MMDKFKLAKRKSFQSIFEFEKSSQPASPVPHLLGTNKTPTLEELALILEVVVTARKYAKDRSSKAAERTLSTMSFLDIPLKSIMRKLEVTQKFIQDHLALTSALRRLPVELWQIIFIYCANVQVREREDTRVSHIPWTISRVCRLWRDISLLTPGMWGCLLHIRLGDPNTKSAEFLDRFKELLKRSEGSKIDVSISTLSVELDLKNLRGHSIATYDGGGHPCLDILMKLSDRWSDLSIIFRETYLLEELSPIKGHLSSLKRLQVYEYDPDGLQSPTSGAIDLFENAIHLKELHYLGQRPLILPRGQLRVLSGNPDTRNKLNRMVEIAKVMLKSLTHLDLTFFNSAHLPIGTTFPKLLDLSLSYYASDDALAAGWFLDAIRTPVLERLTIKETGALNGLDIEVSLCNLLTRSKMPPLYSLKLDVQHQRAGALSKILMLTYFLKHLDTVMPHCADIQRLGSGHNIHDMLVPFLKTCNFTPGESLKQCKFPSQQMDTLQRLGINRCDRAMLLHLVHPRDGEVEYSRIQSLTLHFSDTTVAIDYQYSLNFWEPDDSPQLKRLIEARLVLDKIFGKVKCSDFRQISAPSNPLKVNLKDQRNTKETLEIVENLQVDHVSIIVISQIHSSLAHISKMYKSCKRHALGIMATRILLKWRPLFKKCRNSLKWARIDADYLRFVTEENVSEIIWSSRHNKDQVPRDEWLHSEEFTAFF